MLPLPTEIEKRADDIKISVTVRHDIGKELGVFSEILGATPEMLDRVYNDTDP
jgi:hypothetical protein